MKSTQYISIPDKNAGDTSSSKGRMLPKSPESGLKTYNALLPHQDELYQLSQLAGIHMDPKVFRILVEFLNMGLHPNAIFSVLKSIRMSIARPTTRGSSLSQASRSHVDSSKSSS